MFDTITKECEECVEKKQKTNTWNEYKQITGTALLCEIPVSDFNTGVKNAKETYYLVEIKQKQ